MKRFRFLFAAAILIATSLTPRASAQTPANISVVSGNGQVICQLCTQGGFGVQSFDGMYVKVTDASGNPVANAPVNWTVTFGSGVLSTNGTLNDQTFTNSLGIATENYLVPNQITGSISNPFIQSTISAGIASGAVVTFYETQAFANTTSFGNSAQLVLVLVETPNTGCPTCIGYGDTLTGNAGSTSTVQFKIQVYVPASTVPVVPNVSLRLIPNQTSPTISCATGAGADPGSVLTDSTGTATCTAILGPTAGFGSFYVLVGGVASVGYNLGNPPQGYFQSGNYNLNVMPGLPSSLSIVSGNNQSVTPGQQAPGTLVATVADNAGNPLAGQQVTWTVSPANAATLSNTSMTSDANGRVQTNVTLANTASGQVLIKASAVSSPNISATFTVTALVSVTGLQIVSGNNQTALVNTAFLSPLVVQLTSATGTASGVPVNFAISGPGLLSAPTVNTDSTGRASVNVLAGSTTGAITVTATSGSFSQTFSLTVIPQGPTLDSNSFYNGADFQRGSISPCSIATIIAPGVAAAIQGIVAYNGVGALPYTLGNVQVTFGGAQAPIYNVANSNGRQQVTVQVPCSVTPGSVPVVVSVGGGTGTTNATVLPASPGLFTTQFSGTTVPVLERPDGSFVSPTNPAHRGEVLVAFVTGMGATSPSINTNSLPAPGSTPSIQGTIIVGMNGGGVPLSGSAASADIVGVQTVSFVVPSTTQSGNSTFSIGVIPTGGSQTYNSGLGIFPVQ